MAEDLKYRERVLTQLTRTETKVDSLIEHVKTINGSVRHLYDRDRELEIALTDHQINCPGLMDIKEINKKLSEGSYPASKQVLAELKAVETAEERRAAKENTDVTWRKTLLFPLIRWLLSGLIVLLLLHGHDLLKKSAVP